MAQHSAHSATDGGTLPDFDFEDMPAQPFVGARAAYDATHGLQPPPVEHDFAALDPDALELFIEYFSKSYQKLYIDSQRLAKEAEDIRNEARRYYGLMAVAVAARRPEVVAQMERELRL